MKKVFIFLSTVFLFSAFNFSFAQEQENKEKILIIKEGQEVRENVVAVEAYYLGEGVLEVAVEARMQRQRPKISNILVVGPRLGRLRHAAKEEIPVSLKEEKAYPVTREGGILSTGDKTEVKQLQGTEVKEIYKFKIPKDKIIPGKRYQLWIDLESKTRGGDRPMKFKFNLEKLNEAVSSF